MSPTHSTQEAAMRSARPGTGSETDPGWSRLRDHLQRLTRAVQEEIRTYPTPIAGCDQQFNYLLEKKRQLIGESKKINDALAHGDLSLARRIVRGSEHVAQDVKASVVG
jgi:hypothetical protein